MSIKPIPDVIILKLEEKDPYADKLKVKSTSTALVNGRSWEEITYQEEHGCLWKFGMGLAAFLATLGTFIIGVCVLRDIKNLWRKAISGREIHIVKKEIPEQPRPIESIDQLFKATLQQDQKTDKVEKELNPENANLTTEDKSIDNANKNEGNIEIVEVLPPISQEAGSENHFTKLIDYNIPADHPLSSQQLLLYPAGRTKLAEGAEVKDYLPSHLGVYAFDKIIESFKNCPLVKWLGKEDDWQIYFSKDQEEFERTCEAVKTRVDQLDQAFQFQERIKILQPTLRSEIKIQDLEAAWQESALKIAFMTPEEFASLTLEQMINFNQRQQDFIASRLKIEKHFDLKVNEKEVSIENFKSLTLAEFHSLGGEKINILLPCLNQCLMSLLSKAQIKKLNVKEFTRDQFIDFFNLRSKTRSITAHRVHQLEIEQLHDLWDRLDKYLIGLISLKQLRKLDFNALNMTQEKFDALFSIDHNIFSIRMLSLQQVYALLPFLKKEHLADVSISNLQLFDFKSHQLTEEQLDALLNKETFSGLSLIQIYDLWDRLGEKFRLISETQLAKIDFKEHPLTQAIFDKFFPPIVKTWMHLSLINKLTPQQIYDCAHLFDEFRIDFITPEQVRKMDFQCFQDDEQKKKFINGLFDYQSADLQRKNRAIERFQALPFQQLDQLLPVMPSACFQEILIAQLKELDFSSLTKDQFLNIFYINDDGSVSDEVKERFACLSEYQKNARWDLFIQLGSILRPR